MYARRGGGDRGRDTRPARARGIIEFFFAAAFAGDCGMGGVFQSGRLPMKGGYPGGTACAGRVQGARSRSAAPARRRPQRQPRRFRTRRKRECPPRDGQFPHLRGITLPLTLDRGAIGVIARLAARRRFTQRGSHHRARPAETRH
jgi:hypothetical protein